MHYASGILLQPVQTLVTTSIFVMGKNANKSLLLRYVKNLFSLPDKRGCDHDIRFCGRG